MAWANQNKRKEVRNQDGRFEGKPLERDYMAVKNQSVRCTNVARNHDNLENTNPANLSLPLSLCLSPNQIDALIVSADLRVTAVLCTL